MKLYLTFISLMACLIVFGMKQVVADYKVMQADYIKATECVASHVQRGVERRDIRIIGDTCETTYSHRRNP